MAVRSHIKTGYSFSLLFGTAVSVVGCVWLLSQPDRLRTDGIAQMQSQPAARVRHSSEIEWVERAEAKLYDGTLIDVPMNGTTSITFTKDHGEILEPGSMVRITQTDHGPIRKEVILRRDKHTGGVAYRKQSDFGAGINLQVSQVNLLTPVNDLSHQAAHQQALKRKFLRTYSRTLSMDYVLSYIDYPNLGVFGAFDDYATRPAFPPVGALFKASQQESPCIGFVWSPVPSYGVNYVVEVSKSFSFDYFRSFGATTNFIRLKVNDPADYFWRVRAVKGVRSTVGDTSRFSVYKPPLPPEEIRRQAIVKRIRELNAALMDVEICQ